MAEQRRQALAGGVALKAPTACLELRLERAIVLDDAVVHDGDRLGRMRVGVRLVRRPMGRPARVADAGLAGERIFKEPPLELRKLARSAAALDMAVDDGGDSGGVVASIFQTLQGIDQEVRDRPLAQNADDAAHDVDQRFFGFFGVWRARNDFAPPGFSLWRSRAIASASAATLLVTVLPAATKLPSPSATGATSVALEPMKAPAPMVVRCLAKPS